MAGYKKRHNIRQFTVSREATDVSDETVEGWYERLKVTIAFFANGAGDKEQPIVTGRAAKTRCFKGIRNPKIPEGIPYYANPKAWMTTQVMTDRVKQATSQTEKKYPSLD